MQSSSDIQISFISQLIRHCHKDSQILLIQSKHLHQQLSQLHKHIESKLEAICKQIQPRIEQLEKRIEVYWESVQGMDQNAWKQLKQEEIVFENCREIVDEMEGRVTGVARMV